jgi:hypothetical protein
VRALEELIDRENPAWPELRGEIERARNRVEVLATQRSLGERALSHVQVTTRSTLGAVAFETGGLLVDDAFVRVLGAGCDRMKSNLVTWNGELLSIEGALVVAFDALGGLFAVNGRSLVGEAGHVAYFAPDNS